jgi:tagatose-1,6-bisphosphate aldolase
MLAIDHRQNLKRALGEQSTDSTLTSFKLDVIRTLAPSSSAVLVDPEYGAAQAIASGALAGARGLVIAVEATGYVDDPSGRRSRILSGWSVEKAMRLGADAIKLLVYYHPEASNAGLQEDLVAEVSGQCRRLELPLFLEPLSFAPGRRDLDPGEFTEVVIATAERLTPIGGDVLKAEFPTKSADPADWTAPVENLNNASHIPWAILSGGVSFETFEGQALVAANAGACGVMVGRAVWSEAVHLGGEERIEFLSTTATERLNRLGSVPGPGWHQRADSLLISGPGWYR